VGALQFLLAWHGFPSGTLDGVYGERLQHAVRRYQRFAGLATDGLAGPATILALRSSPPPRSPLRLSWPLELRVGDVFGPRGDRFHAGIDLPANAGAPVRAARAGRVVFAGWDEGGFGNLVVLAHGRGVTTWYAHLSRVAVAAGDRVGRGSRVGRVGSTGHSTGPHLHFEVRLRGASVDPLTALR
jgi:murein DD-endopeptidase MepM/ murein hydrolase activator NlpD